MLIGLGVLVVLVGLLFGGLFVYVHYRFDQIKKIHARHLVKVVAPSSGPPKPFNILVVGSDSRSFVKNAVQQNAFGSGSVQTGQRSDVTMIARIVPATRQVWIMSIPRDLWVNIPGNVPGVSGMNRINTAFNSGPDLLIQTIEQDLGIPINHFVYVNFDGFQNMVNALGGVMMNFPTPVRDSYSGLNVTQTGCQLVPGTTSLELVRARHLSYQQNGVWQYDGLSDFSRIQRQDAFFHAVLSKLNQSITNPIAINNFIGAMVGNLTIDDTLTAGTLFNLATEFHGLSAANLHTSTLPSYGFTTSGGAQVLGMAEPQASGAISLFNLIGTSTSTTTTTTNGGSSGGARSGSASASTTTAPSTTTTTGPGTGTSSTGSAGSGSTTTTTTPAGQVVTNTQPEPWNPVPC